MTPELEGMARALCETSPLDTHRNNGARAWKRYIPQARAGLTWLIENVSDEMENAAMEVLQKLGMEDWEIPDMGEPIKASLKAALGEEIKDD